MERGLKNFIPRMVSFMFLFFIFFFHPFVIMVRIKNRTPRRHHVPPAILFSRKRQLLLNLLRLFQCLGIEVRIRRMRHRNIDYDHYITLPPPPPIHPLPPSPSFTPIPTEEINQTLEEDPLPFSPSPFTPDFISEINETLLTSTPPPSTP